MITQMVSMDDLHEDVYTMVIETMADNDCDFTEALNIIITKQTIVEREQKLKIIK